MDRETKEQSKLRLQFEGRWQSYLARRDELRAEGNPPIYTRRLLLTGEFAPLPPNGNPEACDEMDSDTIGFDNGFAIVRGQPVFLWVREGKITLNGPRGNFSL